MDRPSDVLEAASDPRVAAPTCQGPPGIHSFWCLASAAPQRLID